MDAVAGEACVDGAAGELSAALGFRERGAGGRIRRELAQRAAADLEDLQTQIGGDLPAGGGRVVLHESGGGVLPDRERARRVQADRFGDRMVRAHGASIEDRGDGAGVWVAAG